MIILHHVPQSRSMRVLWLLVELGAEFEVIEHPFDKSLRRPEFLSKSPAGRVPALEIGGASMFESGAMVEYLCELHPDAGMGRAPGDAERMEWLSWVHFAETVSQHIAILTQQHIMLYDPEMRRPGLMKIEAARLKKCYAAIEARLEGRDHLLTSGFSACDIAVGQAIYMGRFFARTDDFAHLTAWWDRITARDGFKAALPDRTDGLLYDQEFYEVPDA